MGVSVDRFRGWLDSFRQDLRNAGRLLKRSPGFSAFVIFTLAFGIGANVVVFSIVRTVLVDALPFPDAQQLFVMKDVNSVPAYEWYARPSTVFSGVAAWVDESMSLVVGHTADRAHGARVSASFFPVLGVRPLLGRSFRVDEDRPGGAAVAMLSYRTWQNRFGGDPEIIGKAVRVNTESLTVAGVLPQSFWFPGEPVEVWVPRVFDNRFVSPQMVRNGAGILSGVFARLRADVRAEQAEAALQVAGAPYEWSRTIHLQPMQQSTTADIRTSLWLLWGAAGCILVVTCTNTAGLLLARATARRKEMAMRLALGGSRLRLVRQLLTESLAFAAVGGVLGFLLARAGLATVAALVGRELTAWRQIEMGASAVIFAVGASLASALIFGLAPALQSLRTDPLDGMRDSSRTASSASQPRLRSALVMGQTAVAVALSIVAALLIQSYARMRTLHTGVRTEGLVTASLRLPDSRYNTVGSRTKFYDELLRRLRNIPGVTIAACTSALQLESKGEGSMTWPEGAGIDPNHPPVVKNRNISPEYFGALGIPVIAGRAFTEADDALSPKVMMVNESFARTYFPGGGALGRQVTYTSEHVTARITGIVADLRPRMIDAAAQPEMYFPYMQRPRHEMTLVLRSSLPLGAAERAIRNELRAVDPEQPLYDVRTMDEVVRTVLSRPRSTTSMVAFLSVGALALAAVGIFGVLSFTVAQRRREIGIRMALGAGNSQIRAMVVRQGMLVVAAGTAVGIPASLAAARLSRTLLFGVSPGDPLTMVAVAAVVLGVGWLAAIIPARHAARIDPLRALQSD